MKHLSLLIRVTNRQGGKPKVKGAKYEKYRNYGQSRGQDDKGIHSQRAE